MSKSKTEGQMAYEARRAAKAGMSLDKWLLRREQEEKRARAAEQRPAAPAKPGWITRLLDRAHRPLGAKQPEAKPR